MTRERDQHKHKDDRKTALRPAVKIGRFEFVDPVHQVAITQIAIDVSVQPPAKGIHERRHRRGHTGRAHATSPMCSANRGKRITLLRATTLDKRSERIDSEQAYT